MTQKILKVFVKTLTVNDKHYALNRDNLRQPIQMQLAQKGKSFPELFFEFLKSILNFKHYTEQYNPRSSCISRITGCEKYVQINF